MRQAFKRWLIKCAAGTTLAVGGAAFVLPLVMADPPAQLVSLGISVARADDPAPGTPVVPAPLPPGETAQIYTVNSIPIVGETPVIVDQVILPGTVQIEPLATIGFQPVSHETATSTGVTPPGTGGATGISGTPPVAILGIIPREISSGTSVPQSFQPVSDHREVSPVGLQVGFPRGESIAPRKAFVDLSAAPCFAHSADYSWIAGRVEYSNIQKEWRIRYASVDEVDRYGGRLTLIENQHLQYLKDGMYVQVRGHLVNPDHSKTETNFYRIEWFQRIENPNQVLNPAPGTKTVPITPGGISTPPVSPVIPAAGTAPATDSSLTLPPFQLTPTQANPNTLPVLPNGK